VLTRLSLFWFDFLKGVVPSHLITANMESYPRRAAAQSIGTASLYAREESGNASGGMRGARLSGGLRIQGVSSARARLRHPSSARAARWRPAAEPDFHAATKAVTGHDVNVPFRYVVNTFGSNWPASSAT